MNKLWISIVVALLLIVLGLLPLLVRYGVLNENPLSFIGGTLRLLVLVLAALWLAVDARNESGYLKRGTEIAALIITIFVLIPVLNFVGVSVQLPVFLLSLQEYVFVISGLLLLIGSFQ